MAQCLGSSLLTLRTVSTLSTHLVRDYPLPTNVTFGKVVHLMW